MTADQYVIGFIGMAVLITAILALGILEAANLLPHPWHRERSHAGPGHRHHWYDRFHHA